MVTSFLCQNNVATSFWRNNDVIIVLCVRWVSRRHCRMPRVQNALHIITTTPGSLMKATAVAFISLPGVNTLLLHIWHTLCICTLGGWQFESRVEIYTHNVHYLLKFTILASMFVCRDVCLSVCLSVLSSITHERFDISSPNLTHICTESLVPASYTDKK